LKKRGVNTNPTLRLENLQQSLYNDWTPTREDKINNLNRIITRIALKPKWYKFHKKEIEDWVSFYEKKYEFSYSFHPSHQG